MNKYFQVVTSARGRQGAELERAQEGQLYLLRRGEIWTVWQREQAMQRLGGWTEFSVIEEQQGGHGGWQE